MCCQAVCLLGQDGGGNAGGGGVERQTWDELSEPDNKKESGVIEYDFRSGFLRIIQYGSKRKPFLSL